MSDTLSPSKIVEGITKVDMGHKRVSFVSYSMVHIRATNTIKIGCFLSITLKASNDSGGHYFMNTFTRKLMHIYNWK